MAILLKDENNHSGTIGNKLMNYIKCTPGFSLLFYYFIIFEWSIFHSNGSSYSKIFSKNIGLMDVLTFIIPFLFS